MFELILTWIEPNGRRMVEREFYATESDLLKDADRRSLKIVETFVNANWNGEIVSYDYMAKLVTE